MAGKKKGPSAEERRAVALATAAAERAAAVRAAEGKYESAMWLSPHYLGFSGGALHAKRTSGEVIICTPTDTITAGDVVEVDGKRWPIHDLSRGRVTIYEVLTALRTKRPDIYAELAQIVRNLTPREP